MNEKRPRARPVPDDAAAWDAVARSVKPLPRKTPAPPVQPPLAAPPPQKREARILPRPQPLLPAQPQPQLQPPARRVPPIEDRLLKAIRRGQTPIDMRIDLHGQTQALAHKRLEQVLATARARGARVVLVVTGTGVRRSLDAAARGPQDESPGVLRRMLPHWLAAPPLSDWVIGFSQAVQGHGGAGAFYILLRRQRAL